MTKIEWTEKTWNPVVGCSVVSPGCTNCYAMAMAARIERMGGAPQYDGTTKPSRAGAVWTGKVALAEKALLEPLKRKKPTTYFVNSMGDLFHEDVPDEWIDQVFAVMALCPQHTFQVLTKRSARMREYVSTEAPDGTPTRFAHIFGAGARTGFWKADGTEFQWPLPNVWLGVSAEDQTRADERIPDLLVTPAAIRFVSAEPLLGPVDLQQYLHALTWAMDFSAAAGGGSKSGKRPPLDQVIVGGESGHNARPMHPHWARNLRDQCEAAGTAFFFKQWGEWDPLRAPTPSDLLNANKERIVASNGAETSGLMAYGPDPWVMRRVGKARAGRLLDGRTWDGVPT